MPIGSEWLQLCPNSKATTREGDHCGNLSPRLVYFRPGEAKKSFGIEIEGEK